MLLKSNIAVLCILGMIGGFLVSRALLSFCTFAIGVNALWNVNPKNWLKHRWWLTGAIWIAIYALTYFWSDDKGNWDTRFQVKLPILLLPLAFSFLPRFTIRQIQVITVGIGVMLFAGCCYSISFLLKDPAYIYKEYFISHVLRTPAKSDYLRFSLTIALYIIWAICNWKVLDKWMKWLVGVLIALLTVYLHILASKSGLVAIYLFILMWGIYITIARRSVWGILAILAIPVAFNFAVDHIPTLSERKGQVMYNMFQYRAKDKSGNYSDLSRLISYDVAFKRIKEHPLQGSGTGDMLTDMHEGYHQYYPAITDEKHLIPHNQFLTVALGCGIPAALIFALWVFMPLSRVKRNRESFFFFSVWIILLVQLMVEPVLEIQFGVFVYIFFMLLFRHILPEKKVALQLL